MNSTRELMKKLRSAPDNLENDHLERIRREILLDQQIREKQKTTTNVADHLYTGVGAVSRTPTYNRHSTFHQSPFGNTTIL